MFSEALQQAIDLFSQDLLSWTQEAIIKKVDYFEHQVYQAIDAALIRFDHEGSKAFNDIYDEVAALNARLIMLHNIHLAHPNLHAREFDLDFFGDINEEKRIYVLNEHYKFFMEHCLDFYNDESQKKDIAVLVRKILSMPKGQRLIIKLNQFAEQRGCRIAVKSKSEVNSSLSVKCIKEFPLKVNDSACIDDMNRSVASSLKLFDPPRGKWINVELSYPVKFWEKSTFFFEALDFGKKTCLVFKPAFVSIAHELIHVLHFFRGKDRCRMEFSGQYDRPHLKGLFMNNMEEMWTIDLGKISENKIREEHHINPRFSHIRVFMFSEGEYSVGEIKSTLTEEHAAHAGICFNAAPTWEKHVIVSLPVEEGAQAIVQRPGCCSVS